MVRSEDALSVSCRRGKMRQHIPLKAPKKLTGEKSISFMYNTEAKRPGRLLE
jgi:hypothetical protein